MKIQEHISKANRIEKTVKKLNHKEDYETFIWGMMHVCSHWINAALHARGVTEEDHDIAHSYNLDNHPNKTKFKKLGDETRQVLAILGIIENIRYTHVRGRGDYYPAVTENTQKAYEEIKKLCKKVATIG